MKSSAILSYFTRHRTAANLLLILMTALGLASMTQIRSQFFPDVVADSITVTAQWAGAGAEDMDVAVVSVLESALLLIDGVAVVQSRSTEGRSDIYLEFEPNWDMERANSDVETALGLISNLPDDVDTPTIRRSRWFDRVTDVIIKGPVSVEQLGQFADEFNTRLFLEGISQVSIRGVAAPSIEVQVNQNALIKHDIRFSDIASLITAEAQADPTGDVANGSARVRSGSNNKTAADIEALVLRARSDGTQLTIGDVADVVLLGADRGRSFFQKNDNAVSLRIDRSAQGDAIKMQEIVEKIAEEMNDTLPEGVELELIRTRSEAIKQRLNILYENGLTGLALVIGLLFLFLNVRTAFWVAAGIPVAMFAAIALMYAAGITINMISLFGLIICLGIVVDDAIVVGEHADARARHLNEPPVVAAENAASRMSLPVFSATITTILAFYGLTAIGGRFGELIADIPYTVIVVLLASLIECFLILPHHMSHALAHVGSRKWYDLPSFYFNIGFQWVQDTLFRPFIKFVILFRYPAVASAVLVLVLSMNLFRGGDVTFRFINFPEQNSISGNIAMLPAATRADTVEMVKEMERAVDVVSNNIERETGVYPVNFVLGEVGGNTGRRIAGTENKDTDLLGALTIELIDADDRPETTSSAFLEALQNEIRKHPQLETMSFRRFRFGPGGDSLSVDLYGPDTATLKSASEAIKARLAEFPEVSALEDSLSFDKEEIGLQLTARARALGFTADSLSRELRARINGIEAASFPEGTRSSDIRVVLPDASLGADFLNTLRLQAHSGNFIPVSDLVEVERKIGFSVIERENGTRIVQVTGDLDEEDPKRAEFISNTLKNEILPEIRSLYGVDYRLSGQSEQERRFYRDATLGYALCLLGIYLTLAWIFASWIRPIVVMAVIPFGLIGTIYGHWIHDVPLSMFSIIGLIGMSGIIINDSIVLIATINEYSQKRGLKPALVDAVADRFRAVLLTTLTTVLGLTPLLFEPSQQAKFLLPTVITLCYGLGVGMFIVLLLVPSFVMIQEDITRHIRSLRRVLFGRHNPSFIRYGFWGSVFIAFASIIALTIGNFNLGGAFQNISGFALLMVGLMALIFISAMMRRNPSK